MNFKTGFAGCLNSAVMEHVFITFIKLQIEFTYIYLFMHKNMEMDFQG